MHQGTPGVCKCAHTTTAEERERLEKVPEALEKQEYRAFLGKEECSVWHLWVSKGKESSSPCVLLAFGCAPTSPGASLCPTRCPLCLPPL